MFKNAYIFAFAFATATLLYSQSLFAVDLSGLTLIRDIKLLASPEEIRVLVKTGGQLDSLPSVRILNDRLLQLDVQKSYTEPAKRSFSINDPFLEKVDIYQMDPTSVRIRLYLLSPFEKGRDSVWKNDGGFILSLKRKLPSSISMEPSRKESSPILEQKKKDGGTALVGGSAIKDESFPTLFNEENNLNDQGTTVIDEAEHYSGTASIIRMLSSLAVVAGLLILGAYIFKKKMLDKGGIGKGSLIRVLDRSYIDIKKGIAIVDVAGEILVVGLSGDGITMLTKVEDASALARIKDMTKKDDKPLFSAIVDDESARDDIPDFSEGEGKPSIEEASKEESVLERIKKLKPLK